MSRIAVVSQFFAPEPCAAANRVAAMAGALADAGHDVHVYTAMPSFPDGVIADGYRDKRYAVERDGRITIQRVRTFASAAPLPGMRLLNWVSVALGIARAIVAARERFDLIVVTSPPITLALPALLGAFAHRAPLVVDARDVWPEIAVAMGAWRRGSIVERLVGRVADALYRRAAMVVCVTETARRQILTRGVDARKVHLAPNGFDIVVPSLEPPLAKLAGVHDVVYVGNMGLATGLDVVLDAAALLQDVPIRFVLIGAGADARRLRARATAERLGNVVFTGSLPRPVAMRALEMSTLTVVPLMASITDSLPTKLFDAMRVGTPVVLSAAGEARSLVERADAGVAATPGDPQALADAIRRVVADRALRDRFARNGRAFVDAHYDRAAVMHDLATRIGALAAR